MVSTSMITISRLLCNDRNPGLYFFYVRRSMGSDMEGGLTGCYESALVNTGVHTPSSPVSRLELNRCDGVI
jgi:hypothetical protein